MNRYLSKKFLLGIGVYLLIGFLVGLWVLYNSAGKDAAIGLRCDSFADCWNTDLYLAPANFIIWLLAIHSNPLMVVAAMLLVVGTVWLILRKRLPMKPPMTRDAR